MAKLNRAHAVRAIEALESHLTRDAFRRARRLAELMDEAGEITAAGAIEALFSAVSDPSANKSLDRLLKAVNEGARQSGSKLRLTIHPDKRLSKARPLWFDGDPEPLKRYDLPDALGAAPADIKDQLGVYDLPKVVLLTFNPHERDEVRARFADIGPENKIEDGVERLGVTKGFEIIHVHSLEGQAQLAAAALTGRMIELFKPMLVIGVGIAMGLAKGQKIGDVLVATEVLDVAMERFNADGSRKPRGETRVIDHATQSKLRAVQQAEDSQPGGLCVKLGRFLCGMPLVDYVEERNRLIALDGQAIGYEMESFGVASEAWRRDVRWALVKAISDWGDGEKKIAKEQRQKLAAHNAAEFVRKVLEDGPFGRGGEPKAAPEPQVAKNRRFDPRKRGFEPLTEKEDQVDAFARADPGERLRLPEKAEGGEQGLRVMDALREWANNDKSPEFFALLGEYGMGKTTTCLRFYQELRRKREAAEPAREPLLFNLKEVSVVGDRAPTLEETVQECMERGWNDYRKGALDLDGILDIMADGAVVMFDGLDEALVKLTQSAGQTFTNGLLRLRDEYRHRRPNGRPARILVSCRTHYFRSLQEQRSHFSEQDRGTRTTADVLTMELLPFTDQQVRDYLHRALPDEDIDKLIAMIGSVHNLTELTRRPYTLRLVRDFLPEIAAERAAGHEIRGVTLYRKTVDRWLARDFGKHQIRENDKRALVARLAAEFWRASVGVLPIHDIEDSLSLWIKERPALEARYGSPHREQLDQDLRTATFLTRRDETEEEPAGFHFAHTSLQEYFLAEYLLAAAREDRAELWQMQIPSQETLDFLGQMLALERDERALHNMSSWAPGPQRAVNELLLAYVESARGADAPAPSLRGLNLSGGDYERHRFADLDLAGAQFRGARLVAAKFERVDLANADFCGAALNQAVFDEVHAEGARFDDCDFTGAWLHRSALARARAERALGASAWALLCDGAEGVAKEKPFSMRVIPPARAAARGGAFWMDGHSFCVTACAFAPDGKSFLSGDNTLRLWDASARKTIAVLEGHSSSVTACAFAPDGKSLLSASSDNTLRLWDANTSKTIAVLEGHSDWVRACAFAPDGKSFLSASEDKTLRLWDAASRKSIAVLEGHSRGVTACAFPPDGKTFLSASYDNTLRLWDAASRKTIAVLEAHSAFVNACTFGPDGKSLLSASGDGTLRLWDAASRKGIAVLEGHSGSVLACAFAPDGKSFLSASDDSTLRLWDANTRKTIAVLEGHSDCVRACAFAPDGKSLLSASDDHTLRLWDAASRKSIAVLEGHYNWVRACAFAPDGKSLLSARADKTLRLWDASARKAIAVLEGHSFAVNACTFAPDSKSLLSASDDHTLRLWDAASRKSIAVLEGHSLRVNACAFAPDGKSLLSASDDETLRLWDAASRKVIAVLEGHTGSVTACAFAPDGKSVLSASSDDTLRLWNAASRKVIAVLEGHTGSVTACAFASDGKSFLSASDDNTLRLWDAASRKVIAVLEGHTGSVTACAFAPDGKSFLSASDDNTLRLWDAASRKTTAVLEGHSAPVLACAFAPDGKSFLSASDDKTLRLWDAQTHECVAILRATDTGGWAAWNPSDNSLISAGGDAWRYLHWRLPGLNGVEGLAPMEALGDVCERIAPTAGAAQKRRA